MSRLSIELTPEQHQQIKAMALIKGKTIKDFILDRIFDQKHDEEKTWNELMHMLDKRIESAEKGAISNKNIEDIAQGVLKRNDLS